MTLEIEYSNPGGISHGKWAKQMAQDIVPAGRADTPDLASGDVGRAINGNNIKIRLRGVGKADASPNSINRFKKKIENHLPNATHVATRDVEQWAP